MTSLPKSFAHPSIRSLTLACALGTLAVLIGSTAAAEPASSGMYLPKDSHDPRLLVFPPRDRSLPRPVVVMLHGKCDTPENECRRIAESMTERAWLVCPRGDTPCSSGGASWSASRKTRVAEQALEALRGVYPNQIDENSGHTLAGFSLGAFVAVRNTSNGKGPFRNLLLIGARTEPNAEQLQQSGIQSIIFMAGEWDMTFAHMSRQATWFQQRGIPSRFIGLGPVGHSFPADINRRLREALDFIKTGG